MNPQDLYFEQFSKVVWFVFAGRSMLNFYLQTFCFTNTSNLTVTNESAVPVILVTGGRPIKAQGQ